jgi:glycosyltransferase involved in cell wall biosynthesis
MAEAILRLLDDPARAREQGQAGRSRVEERFTEERMIRRYEALYAELAAGAGIQVARSK